MQIQAFLRANTRIHSHVLVSRQHKYVYKHKTFTCLLMHVRARMYTGIHTQVHTQT